MFTLCLSAARRSAALAALCLTALLAAGAAGADAADLTLATNGADPSIAVDSAGTGHVAWYAQTGSTNQVVYCRLPRGAADCSVRKVLATPGNQSTFNRSQILLSGSKVILIASFINDIRAWISPDGGTTWPAIPVTLSKDTSLNQAVLGAGGFSVNMIGDLGPRFVSAALDGSNAATNPFSLYAGLGDASSNFQGGGVAMLNSTTPIVTFSDGERSWIRRYNPSAITPNNAANWLPAQQLGTRESQTAITSGPSGTYTLSASLPDHPLGYGPIVRRIGDDGTVGAAQNIRAPYAQTGPGFDSTTLPTISEDAGGRVHAIYQLANGANPLIYQWSKRGETWGQPITLIAEAPQARGMQIGAAPDGGGWLAYEINPGAYGQIHVLDLAAKGDSDPPVPTPVPGPGPQPTPPPAPACPLQLKVSSQASAMVRSGPCFKDLGKGKYSTTGTVRLNGLDLVPSGGATTTVDTKAHRVQTKGKVEITAGSVVLSRSPVDWDLDGLTTIPDLAGFGVSLLGFKLAGTADLSFTGGEARIHVYVELPSPLDKVRGDTTLRTTMTDGLRLDDLHLRADNVPIGPVTIETFDVVFSGGTNRFEGNASVLIPPGASKSLVASFGMENGQLRHLDLEAGAGTPGLPLPLSAAPPVFLGRIGMSLANDATGFRISGGVKIDAGASIGGKAPISVDMLPSSGGGAYVFVPQSRKYAEIGAKGTVRVVDFPLASGQFLLRTDGPVTASGQVGLDVGPIDVTAKLGAGVNLSNGDFYGEGSAEGCGNGIVVEGCGKLAGIVSSIGISLCGSGELSNPQTGASIDGELGWSRPWGGDSSIGSCDLDDFKPASLKGLGSRAGQRLAAGPQVVRLGGGKVRGIRIEGAGGRPGFTLSGPGGRTITVPAGLGDAVIGDRLLAVPATSTAVEVQVQAPAGDWTITPTGGAPEIAKVLTASERPAAKATGRVSSAGGRARRLTVRASDLGGQRLLVRELLPGGGAQELGTIRSGGTSTLRFTPADGAGGKRTIQAVVLLGGRQVDTLTLGAYTAPGPITLPAPRRVTLTRSKVAAKVRWTRVAGAAGYVITVKGSDGRRQRLLAKGSATSLAITQVTGDDRLEVRVQARSKLSRLGAARAATSKARVKIKRPKG